jgi:hypothetical protein
MTKTHFSSANSSEKKSVFLNGGGRHCMCSDDNDFIKLMKSCVYKNIYFYIIKYINNNFSYLIENLTTKEYETLSVELYNFRKPQKIYYEIFRKNVGSALQVVYQSTFIYRKYILLEKSYINDEQKLTILDNVEQLKDYLTKLISSIAEFDSMNVTMAPLVIRQEYLIYYQMYMKML